MVFLKSVLSRTFLCTFVFVLILSASTPAFSEASEYQLKARFLFNFTHFVTWPESAFKGPDSPFQICVVGRDPFGHFLDDTVTSERVGQHPIIVHRIQHLKSTVACHMIFLSKDSPFTEEQVLSTVRDHPVLLTGETPEFARKGGTIAFLIEDRRIRLQVNLRAAREAKLQISSKLLTVSDVIEED
jgi:hypothetical protein